MSDRTLVGMGLKLEDVGGDRRIGGLDLDRILTDLRDAGVPARLRTWLSLQSLECFDRVLLARGDDNGRYEAMLLVQCQNRCETPFLSVEALSQGTGPRDVALLQRLLAFLMLRLDTLQEKPVAILGQTRNPSLVKAMHDVASGLSAARFYPEPADSVVSWATASLAHRIAGHGRGFDDASAALRGEVSEDGPMLAAIDLRSAEEATLIEDARRLFRRRLSRLARTPLVRKAEAAPWMPAHIASQARRVTPLSLVSIR